MQKSTSKDYGSNIMVHMAVDGSTSFDLISMYCFSRTLIDHNDIEEADNAQVLFWALNGLCIYQDHLRFDAGDDLPERWALDVERIENLLRNRFRELTGCTPGEWEEANSEFLR